MITSLGGKSVDDSTALSSLVDEHKPGDQVQVEVSRGGAKQTLTITLGERPDTSATSARSASSSRPLRPQASAAAGSPHAVGRRRRGPALQPALCVRIAA